MTSKNKASSLGGAKRLVEKRRGNNRGAAGGVCRGEAAENANSCDSAATVSNEKLHEMVAKAWKRNC